MKWTKYVFFIFWGLSLLSFIPSIGAGFVFDFLGWQKAYSEGTFADIVNCFGYKGNHQFLHLIFYSFYQLFHIQGLPWYFLFCSIHAINGFLIYILIIRLTRHWQGDISPVLAALAACILILHPYSVEAVVRKECVHYLISLTSVLLILLSFLRYSETGERKMIFFGSAIYLCSLFTLEISFMTPLVISICGFITYLISDNKKKDFHSALRFAGSLWTLLAGYLLLNVLTLGKLVGHYGEQVHFRFDLLSVVSTEIKYLFKHVFYARFYSFRLKQILFDQVLSYPAVTFFWMTILISVILLYFIKVRKLSAAWHIGFFGLISSLLYILPVANMYFFHLQLGMNDRYSYIPMAFLVIAIISVLSKLPPWVRYSFIGVLLAINIFFQQKTLRYWHQSNEVLSALIRDFRWHDAPYVFVLNSPDNLNGIVMASVINRPSGIEEFIDFQTQHPYDGVMFDVFQYNMTTPDDGVKVEQTGPMQLKVSFNQWGNWWHNKGIGGTAYENEYYKAEPLDFPYLVTFKQFPEGSVVIYQVGKEWKEFPFTPDSVGD